MKNIVVIHDNLFGERIGSTEKLLVDFIRILAGSGRFRVWALYQAANGTVVPDGLETMDAVVRRSYESFGPPPPPAGHLTQNLDVARMLEACRPDGLLTVVGDPFNPLVMQLPPSLPLLLVSPFGFYCSNGNVRRLYVSGQANTMRLRHGGISIAEQYFNPLGIPPYDTDKDRAWEEGRPVVFGRTGRADDAIFDPISLQAFAQVERVCGDAVRYLYVNPPPRARALAGELGLRQVEFLDWLDEDALRRFYTRIDVFAHARYDGETLGISIAEALLAQNPVITHVSKVNNEHLALLKEPFGWVAPVDDAGAYAAAMMFFVENRARIGALGRMARDHVEPLFSPDAIGRKLVADVEEICAFAGRPRDPFDIF